MASEDTLRIQLPVQVTTTSFDAFCADTRNNIKHLIIEQEFYYRHHRDENIFFVVTIPDTIANLTEVESIAITAKVETLPISLCQLKKLELLDLSGCYNILSIPSEIGYA